MKPGDRVWLLRGQNFYLRLNRENLLKSSKNQFARKAKTCVEMNSGTL